MKSVNYYRSVEGLPPAPICNIILNGKIIFEEFLMSTLLELVLNKNIELKNDKLYFVSSKNLKEYQFDIINLLFDRYEADLIIRKEILFVMKQGFKYETDERYRKLYDSLEEEAKKNNTSVYDIYKGIIKSLEKKHNVISYPLKTGGIFGGVDLGGFEFITLCNTTELEKKIISYSFINIDNLTGKSIEIQEIKDLYINLHATKKIKYWKKYFIDNLIKELSKEKIFINNFKKMTTEGKEIKEKLLGLKKFINDYSLLCEKDFENYILWGEYLSYATALGICNKIETVAENPINIQIDDIIDGMKKITLMS